MSRPGRLKVASTLAWWKERRFGGKHGQRHESRPGCAFDTHGGDDRPVCPGRFGFFRRLHYKSDVRGRWGAEWGRPAKAGFVRLEERWKDSGEAGQAHGK